MEGTGALFGLRVVDWIDQWQEYGHMVQYAKTKRACMRAGLVRSACVSMLRKLLFYAKSDFLERCVRLALIVRVRRENNTVDDVNTLVKGRECVCTSALECCNISFSD